MSKTYIQVRTNAVDKQRASEILEELGTNISAVVNMLLKQIIMTKSIPFEVKMNQPYTKEDMISEVQATMALEEMELTKEDISLLHLFQNADKSQRELMRKDLIKECSEV